MIQLVVHAMFAATFGAAAWTLYTSVRDGLPALRRIIEGEPDEA